MTNAHPCDDELAAYVAARLSPDEAVTVEQHLLQCPRCRDIVTLGMVVREEHSLRSKRRPARVVVPALSLLAAAAAAVWFAGSRNTGHAHLGDVLTAPVYEGIAVRAAATRGDSLFRAGMFSYTNGRFAEALEDLQRARSAGADSAATTFFIGASALMQGSPQNAATEFERAAKVQASPYAAESEYYRAKALIRLGRLDSAIRSLHIAAASGSPIALSARALLDSLSGNRGER